MSETIHDDEPDTGAPVVRALLRDQCPAWAARPLTALRTSGTDNAMWRVDLDDGARIVVRLPRRPSAAAHAVRELTVLRQLSTTDLPAVVPIPTVRHIGAPHPAFPHHWGVLDWLPGTDGWCARHELAAAQHGLALDLARAVEAIGTIEIGSDGGGAVTVEQRTVGHRGGPIAPVLDRLDRWLDDPQWNAAALLDVAAVRRECAAARELVGDVAPLGFVHGDLIPGNLLVDGRMRLAAVIDWGGAALADPAQDLAPAWAVLDAAARSTFRAALGVDDATWGRARAFELEHAVGGVLYYEPRRHPLGDVMRRTLHRILDD